VVVDATSEIFGDVPNVAARAQAVAEPGAVVITARVQRQVAGLFVVEERGNHALKGVPEPVTLYRIVRASGGGRRAGQRHLTPLVGRAEEIAMLMRRWERARQGDGQLALIVGERGRPDFPLNIDRRRLLTSAAATVTSTGILPGVKLADAAAADVLQSSPLTRKAEPRNCCAATARRLLEIARRNEVRREAKLPLLQIAKELRRMKKQEELEEFERFEAVYGKAVWEEVLKARREAEGSPNWWPTWMEGISYQSEVYKILRQRFYAARRVASLNSGTAEALKSPAASK
jgi:hypothetical protein